MARRRRYRGRGRIRRALTIISVFMGVMLVLTVVLMMTMRDYLYRDDEGNWHLSIFDGLRVAETALPPADTPTPPPETEEPASTPAPTPPPTPTPKSQLPIHALYAPLAVVTDENAQETLLEHLTRMQADALVLECKADDGALAYPSSQPTALQARVSSDSEAAVGFIRALKADGVYVVAKISCFKDYNLPGAIPTVGIKVSDGTTNWLEGTVNGKKVRWLDPYKQDARGYLLGVLSEVASYGVDEILMDWVTFPTKGKLSAINYGAFRDAPRYEAIESFVREARDAVASSGAALSMILNEKTCMDGEDEIGGQRLSALAPLLDRFYVSLPLSGETGAVFEEMAAGIGIYLSQSSWPAGLVPMLPVDGRTNPEALPIALDDAGGRLGLGWMLVNDRGEYPDLAEY